MIEKLGPQLAIGTDGIQWIVLRRKGERWRACGFVHSDKRALIACIEAKGLKLSAAGCAALNRQSDRIWRWRKAGEKSYRPAGAPEEASGTAQASVVPFTKPKASALQASKPDRFNGMVSAGWLAAIERDTASGARRHPDARQQPAGTTPELIADVQAAAAREKEILSRMKGPLTVDEHREIAARTTGRRRRMAA
jgi:hypothetical protein